MIYNPLIYMKKVLVIGGGGREHAIVDALSRSPQVEKIFCAPGNAGISAQAECVAIKDTDVEGLKAFALENAIDLAVVGPEVSLAAGVVDAFKAAGLRIFGPSKAAATIEASKDFAKQLMAKYDIPTAAFETFEDYEAALEYVKKGSFPVVLKYDGLAAGKGVVIPETLEEAEETLKDMLLDDKFGKGKVVVEEFLTGPEFSFMCFVDGTEVYPMTLSQDHKRAYDNDEGPNTGGMGAYSPVPFVTEEIESIALEQIMKPTAAAMVAEGVPFCGVLYGGLILTEQGPKVIEFNAKVESAAKRYAKIADFIGLGGETVADKVENLIQYLRAMNDKLNIPQCIKNYGADALPCEQGFVPENVFLERLPEIAKNAVADACTGSNPRKISVEEMEKLLKCCYYDTEVDF